MIFDSQGFLVIEDFFTPNELNPAINAIDDLVDDLAQQLYNAGKIKGSDTTEQLQ